MKQATAHFARGRHTWRTLINLNPGNSATVHLAICGAGAAALGLLSWLKRASLLRGVLDAGVVVIDASAQLGAGRLGSYRIPANSHGRVFAECCEGVLPLDAAPGADAPAPGDLLLSDDQAPRLVHAAQLLRKSGGFLLSAVGSHPRAAVLSQCRVVHLRRRGGAWRISVRDADGRIGSVTARNVVLALGGVQARQRVLSQEILTGVTLAPFAGNIVSSDHLLSAPAEEIERLVAAPRVGRNIVVIGGSHSAVSVIGRLLSEWEGLGRRSRAGMFRSRRRIILARRRPFRYYYPSVDAARLAGYEFDDVADVCPVTGKVNRYSGLRYQAAALARRIENNAPDNPVRHVMLPDFPSRDEIRSVQRILRNAGLIVSCTGYHAREISFFRANGAPFSPLRDPDGGLHVDKSCRLFGPWGEPLNGVFGMGLGAGIRIGRSTGGEPSFKGRLDAIYVYHNEVARTIALQMTA